MVKQDVRDQDKKVPLLLPRRDEDVRADADALAVWKHQPLNVRLKYAHIAAQQASSPTDPFSTRRVYSHVLNGVHTPLDYGVRYINNKGVIE